MSGSVTVLRLADTGTRLCSGGCRVLALAVDQILWQYRGVSQEIVTSMSGSVTVLASTTNTRPSYGRNQPKWSQTILNRGANNSNRINPYPLIPDHLVRLLGGPEKAGVGGSIPV